MEKSNLTEIKLGAPSSIEEGASPKANFSLDKGVRLTNIKLDDEGSKCTKEGALKTFIKILLVWKEKGFEYVEFKDPEVLRVLIEHGVGDSEGIAKEQLAATTSIGTWFKGNDKIKDFSELSLTGAIYLDQYAFYNCTELEKVNVENIKSFNFGFSEDIFRNTKIKYLFFNSLTGMAPRLSIKSLFLFPNVTTQNMNYWVRCDGAIADFGSKLNSFQSDYQSLAAILILRKDSVVSATGSWNYGKPYRVYVPSNLILDYKNESVWGAISSRIYSIGGEEWQSAFGSDDEYADIDKYVDDPVEREKIKEAYRNT